MSNPNGRPLQYEDVDLTCRQCKQPFTMRGSAARGYEKKHGVKKPYCSMKCFYAAAHRTPRDLSEPAPLYTCEGCGELKERRRDMIGGERKGGWDYRQKFCAIECFHAAKFKIREAERANGILPAGHIDSNGYHVTKIAHGKMVRMHRVVMERKLGRPLRGNENVHHKNGNRADNDLSNLELWVKTQPCGQRVEDRVAAAIELLVAYPEFMARAGYGIVSVPPVIDTGG